MQQLNQRDWQTNLPRNYEVESSYEQSDTYLQANEWEEQVAFDPNIAANSFYADASSPNPSSIPNTVFQPSVPLPESITQSTYMQGYLFNQIGKLMRVEFLIGNSLNDRVGILEEVGASYIVLRSLDRRSTIMCDLDAIKFVTTIDKQTAQEWLATF